MSFRNLCGHLKTITDHKFKVMHLCFRCGMPLQGLKHDLSKYTPIELKTGAKYYQGDRSPNAAEKRELGYSEAWLHHKGRNKHHFEYWLDLAYDGSGVVGAKMPLKYVLEMTCDRIGACKAYHRENYRDADPWEYYCSKRNAVEPCLHPDTAKLLTELLCRLRDEGEEKTIAYMRWLLRHPEYYENISRNNAATNDSPQ